MCAYYPAVVFVISLCIASYEQSLIKAPPKATREVIQDLTSHLFPAKTIQTLFQETVGTGEQDGRNHPCYRNCDGIPKTCYYRFNVEWYQTMSKACYDCPYNATDCGRKDCIPANGISRTITVINRKMPGPSIEVCQHDTIIVDVENNLMSSGTTIHWHGIHQKETPYMDGAPFVTQCPISPESTFRYEFKATQAGTHFYHSHIGLQRADGVAGPLVIRKPQILDPHGKLYDGDMSEHVLLLTDWVNQLALPMLTDFHHSSGDNRPIALLINGGGKFAIRDENRNNNKSVITSAPRFEVEKGCRYRFRLINAEFLNCPVEISVDGHNITVIATDGSELEPITATSLILYAGERWDIVIYANQPVNNYLIRMRGHMDCTNRVKQVAVLHYKGATSGEPPSDNLTWADMHRNGLQINSVNQGEEQTGNLTISKLKSLYGPDDSLKAVPDYKIYISYDLYAKDNSPFHKPPYYGINQVDEIYRLLTPQLNHIAMKLSDSPLLVDRPSSSSFCNQSTINETCKVDFCQCAHVIQIDMYTTVEVIIVDEGNVTDNNHPFHLHGFSFGVLGQQRLGTRTTVNAVKEHDRAGRMTRNLRNPPIKDTVTVPDGGYTVIRFKADNPGYWLLHCHIEFHADVGMALAFKVGEHKDMKPVPKDFPSCGNYVTGNYKAPGETTIL